MQKVKEFQYSTQWQSKVDLNKCHEKKQCVNISWKTFFSLLGFPPLELWQITREKLFHLQSQGAMI